MIVTDRSRIESWWRCRRLFYYLYKYGGWGLVSKEEREPLAFGKGVHAGADILSSGGSFKDAWAELEKACEGIKGLTPDNLERRDEYRALGYGHLRTFNDYFLPRFTEEYEYIPTLNELEILYPLDSAGEVMDMVRIDGGARRKSDGIYMLVEYKTDAYPENVYEKYFYNKQILLEMAALSEHLGEEVGGAILVTLAKGKKQKCSKKDVEAGKFGWRRYSPFCYAWKTPLENYTKEWKYGYTRAAAWVEPGLEEWYNLLKEENEELVDKQIHYTQPIPFHTKMLDDVKEQMYYIESQNAEGIARIKSLLELGDVEAKAAMNAFFPQNGSNCWNDGNFGEECPYTSICYNALTAKDPMKSGLYEWRVPNHPLESSIIEQEVGQYKPSGY